MNKKAFILCLTSLLLITGCDHTNSSSSNDENVAPYQDVQRNAHKGKRTDSITLRFYKETPHVPYIDISTYMKDFYFLDLDKSVSNGIYSYAGEGDILIQIDAENELFTVSDVDNICDLDYFKLNNLYLDVDESYVSEPQNRTYDFKPYNIDLRDNDNEAYVPLTTLNNIFTWIYGYSVSYNGRDVYVINPSAEVYENSDIYDYDDYYGVLQSKTTFAKDEAEYNYNEFCFMVDHLFGLPQRMAIGRENIINDGLDKTLDSYPNLKKALKSTNVQQYVAAQSVFHSVLTNDGGHSGASYQGDYDIMQSLIRKDSLLKDKRDTNSLLFSLKYDSYYAAAEAKSSFDFDDFGYYKEDLDNKIAYIGFDHFTVDYEGWTYFYLFGNGIPTSTDTFAYVVSKLNVAINHNIENIVFDITTNGGGDVNALLGMISLVSNGSTHFNYTNTLNDIRKTQNAQIDYNLDGKFDASDVNPFTNMKFAVLTSAWSFSCANAFPTAAKDLGVMIIGEQSGGGSCCVAYYNDSYGIQSRCSGVWKITTKNGTEKDYGVEVDVDLSKDDNDYSDFFNLPLVKTKMDEFYSR